uniref:Uncharacterized protein n=1 Tax=Tetraselmis sp. GSL018 TaxID=582737 RepID=A0A061SFG2_9CHLO
MLKLKPKAHFTWRDLSVRFSRT